MNDSDTTGGNPADTEQQEEKACCKIKKNARIFRDFLIRMGVPPGWGTVIAALLAIGMAVLMSLASSGCRGSTSWNLEGEQGRISIRRDAGGAIVIEGKRRLSVEEQK